MKIDNIGNKQRADQNFTAIRVVKATPKEYMNFTKEFSDFCKNKLIFRADSFEQSMFWENLKKIPQKENASPKWVINNAVRYNLIDSDTIENLPVHVFTGKDKMKLTFYNVKNFIPNLIRIIKLGIKQQNENFPEHLRQAKILKENADMEIPKFKKFLKKNNAKHVSFDEFIKEIKEGKFNY